MHVFSAVDGSAHVAPRVVGFPFPGFLGIRCFAVLVSVLAVSGVSLFPGGSLFPKPAFPGVSLAIFSGLSQPADYRLRRTHTRT